MILNHVFIINSKPGVKTRCKMGEGNHEAKKTNAKWERVAKWGVADGRGDCYCHQKFLIAENLIVNNLKLFHPNFDTLFRFLSVQVVA